MPRPRHVGGDGDGAQPSGLGDDVRFLLVIAGVEHVVIDASLLEQFGQVFGFLDRDRADQYGLPRLLAFLDLHQDGVVFLVRRAVNLVILIVTDARQIGRNREHIQSVNICEFLGFRGGGSRHAGEFVVQPEIVLERDRGEGLVLLLDGDAFLGFQGLVQSLGITPSLHHAAGELVDDDDLVVLDDVVSVPGKQLVGAECLVDVVDDRDVGDVVERAVLQLAGLAQDFLDPFDAGVGERHGSCLFVDFVVCFFEGGDHYVDGHVKLG